jgi:hypothetical protein
MAVGSTVFEVEDEVEYYFGLYIFFHINVKKVLKFFHLF